jgi:hypothetical protein
MDNQGDSVLGKINEAQELSAQPFPAIWALNLPQSRRKIAPRAFL